MLKKYGFSTITIDGLVYQIEPTFSNIAKLGEPKEIVQKMQSFITSSRLTDAVSTAIEIIDACCSAPLPKEFVGEFVPTASGLKYKPGKYIGFDGINDLLVIAEHCLKHAIIGPTEQGAKTGNPMTEFDPYEYIELACEHLGKSTEEAANMTMTQFVRAMRVKFPELNSAKKKQGFTDEELDWHKKMMKLDEERAAKAALKNATKA